MKSIPVLVLLLFLSSWWVANADDPQYLEISGIREHSALNLRAKASTKARKIGRIPHGTTCLPNFGCNRYGWCKVSFHDKTGWIAKSYTQAAHGCDDEEENLDTAPEEASMRAASLEAHAPPPPPGDTVASLGDLKAGVEFSVQALEALFPDWQVEQVVLQGATVLRAWESGEEQLLITPQSNGQHIGLVYVRGSRLEPPGGVALGSLFADAYPEQTASGCRVGAGETLGAVVCKAPGKENVYFVFRPDSEQTTLEEIPPPSRLMGWALREVIWSP